MHRISYPAASVPPVSGVTSLPSFDYLSAVDFNSENSYSFKRKAGNDGTLPMLGTTDNSPFCPPTMSYYREKWWLPLMPLCVCRVGSR